MPQTRLQPLDDLLLSYARFVPAASTDITEFRRFAQAHPDAFERSLAEGHFTGSAWLVSGDGKRVLLT
ncbi:MAG: NUDIX hydrolase, partial [Xanthomonadales bacterium]|nr:NUDIX hydrolase [Xanthomonadales bacterium]